MSAFQHALPFAQPSHMLDEERWACAGITTAGMRTPEHPTPTAWPLYAPPPPLPCLVPLRIRASQKSLSRSVDESRRDNWGAWAAGSVGSQGGLGLFQTQFHPITAPSNGPLLHPAALRDMMTHQHLVPFTCDDERYGDGDGKASRPSIARRAADEEERVLLERRGDGGWGCRVRATAPAAATCAPRPPDN